MVGSRSRWPRYLFVNFGKAIAASRSGEISPQLEWPPQLFHCMYVAPASQTIEKSIITPLSLSTQSFDLPTCCITILSNIQRYVWYYWRPSCEPTSFRNPEWRLWHITCSGTLLERAIARREQTIIRLLVSNHPPWIITIIYCRKLTLSAPPTSHQSEFFWPCQCRRPWLRSLLPSHNLRCHFPTTLQHSRLDPFPGGHP